MARPTIQDHIKLNMRAMGLHIQAVTDNPSFVYTTGMTTYGLPELIVFGLEPNFAANMLMHIFHQSKEKLIDLEADQIQGVLEHPMLSRVTDEAKAREYGAQAFFYYEDQGIKPYFKQLVYADDNGLYPDSPDASPKLKRLQHYIGKEPLASGQEAPARIQESDSPSP